jgi:D-glycero-alpha-D-manno-heptose 1-phosphate guanylyltransferase
MQAIILAGGLGTRLKSVVADKPKALSPVAGKPFLHYVIQYLQKEGVTDFIFSLGYLSEQIIDFLNQHYPKLTYQTYVEASPLGTGGAIKKAIALATVDDVLIVNADTYFDVTLKKMYQLHLDNNAHCTIALKKMVDFDRYGAVELDTCQNIINFKDKCFTHEGLIHGGFVFLNKPYFIDKTNHLPEVFSFEKDFLEKNLSQMITKGYESEGYFIDIGIPEDFAKAQDFFASFE